MNKKSLILLGLLVSLFLSKVSADCSSSCFNNYNPPQPPVITYPVTAGQQNPLFELAVSHTLTSTLTLPNGITLIPNTLLAPDTKITNTASPGGSNAQQVIVSKTAFGKTIGSTITFTSLATTNTPVYVYSQRLLGPIVLKPLTVLPAGTVLTKNWSLSGNDTLIGTVYEGRTNYDLNNDAIPLTDDPNYDCRCGSLTQPCKCVTTYYLPPNVSNLTDPRFTHTTITLVSTSTADFTATFQNAINTIATLGAGGTNGGTIYFTDGTYNLNPAVGISITGLAYLQVVLQSPNTLLQFENYISCTQNQPVYPASLITIKESHDIVFVGNGGNIDGGGYSWWKSNFSGTPPRFFGMDRVSTILFENIVVTNSPTYHFNYAYSNNATHNNVTIYAAGDSPNTDGIDMAGSHYLVENCTISNGDDNVMFKGQNIFCSDAMVRNCTIGSGHGIGAGGSNDFKYGVDNMIVRDCCWIADPTSATYLPDNFRIGIRLKSSYEQAIAGYAQNFTFENLTMLGVPTPISFNLFYPISEGQMTVPEIEFLNTFSILFSVSNPILQNIVVKNLNASKASNVSLIAGLPLVPNLIQGLVLKDVCIKPLDGFPYQTRIYNTLAEFLGNVNLGPTVTYNAMVISEQPCGKCVLKNGSFSLETDVIGTSGLSSTPPSYQWLLSCNDLANGVQPDGSTVSGANLNTLNVSNAKKFGSYSVAVSNYLDAYPAAGAPALVPSFVELNSALANVCIKANCCPSKCKKPRNFVKPSNCLEGCTSW